MAKSDIDPLHSALLEEVYLGLVRSRELSSILIYKGARVLKQMLVTTRYSQDIDVTLRAEFVAGYKTIADQKNRLTELMTVALREHFESADPVRYVLTKVDLKVRPGRTVPDRWRHFATFLHVRDALSATLKELVAQVDISVGELLSDSAIANITINAQTIYAYSLQRIAGEKLRAFLSCLPTYRRKMGLEEMEMERRAKDLFDLARILAERPISDGEFWNQAAREFVLACDFRRIDCVGMDSFLDDWAVTELEYNRDERLSDISIARAKDALQIIVTFLNDKHYVPLVNPWHVRD